MTEVLSKWVNAQTASKGDTEWERVHPLSSVAAHFWLRAFVQRVELKTLESSVYKSVGDAFDEVVREFGLDGGK